MSDLQILSNLALLSTSAARQMVEDPVLLALQGHVGCLSPGAAAALGHSASAQASTNCAGHCRRSSPTDRTRLVRR